MQINIKTSEKNIEIVRSLTRKLGEGIAENIIARIALAFSIQSDKKFTTNEFQLYDSKGKEYKDHILFEQQSRDFYIAMICQHYGIYKTDENIPKYVKLHVDHGLELLESKFEDSGYTMFDFLSEYIEKGCKYLTNTTIAQGSVKNSNQNIQKNWYPNLVKVEVGNRIDTNEPIFLHLNDNTKYNNCHIAIAGNSGTGKTQFALDFINQIYKESNGQINYIYLDFKGLKQEDVVKYDKFFSGTETSYIDIPQTPFPINPLTFIDNVNEMNKEMGIDKFVDIVCKYSQLGTKQQSFLREATKEAFMEQKSGTYPSFDLIKEKLDEIYEKKDSLSEIVDQLCRYNVFDTSRQNENFLNKNLYLSLSGDLPNTLRFTSLFLIINYIYNVFMNMPDSPTENNVKALRYVIMIDEAHTLFKEKKYQEILERMLREIRSKGVAIVLLSQGIEEYNQPSFDFSSMCEIAFLLDINDKGNTKAMEKFMGLSSDKSKTIAQSMSKIQKGQVISNIKEFETGKLFVVSQYWKR